jgi:DNA-binding NarL/FixJ family response regulator
MESKRRILLLDDHPIVRQGLVQLINSTEDLCVAGQASTGREMLDLIRTARPDAVIIDISLEDRNGVELIKDILQESPNLPCLALSMYDESVYAMRVLRAGGRGYLMKHEMPRKVIAALRRILEGEVYLSEKMSTRLVDHLVQPHSANEPAASQLSDRELEILTLIGRGQSAREVAEKLFLSVKTVEAHRERIKEKLNLRSGAEFLRYAMQFTLTGTSSKPRHRR